MNVFNEKLLKTAAEGNIDSLVQLDKCGFLLGENEDGQAYVNRIQCFKKNLAVMEEGLKEKKGYELEGLYLMSSQRIPASVFNEANDVCKKLYGFSIDWVPGFFMNPSFSFLFGGCAYGYYPDFFSLFIIRESFRKKRQWLMYNRKELLAHELCHVARVALNSETFEETFAYQTSSNGFRRLLGGIFLRQQDSFIFLMSVFLFLLGQIFRVFVMPQISVWWFASLPIIAFVWLSLRYYLLMRIYHGALRKLTTVFQTQALAVLFRCSDDEIRTIAKVSDIADWIEKNNTLHWQVIKQAILT